MKKFLSVTLCLVILFSCCSTFSFAHEADDDMDKISAVYNDPNSSVLDIIRVAAPEMYASMTEEQKEDFDAINYQEAKANAKAGIAPQYLFWNYALIPTIDCRVSGRITFTGSFTSMSILGSSDCSYIGVCCLITDTTTKKTFAFESDYDRDTNSVNVSSSETGSIAGHIYENECEAYGYDPDGNPFVFFEYAYAQGT